MSVMTDIIIIMKYEKRVDKKYPLIDVMNLYFKTDPESYYNQPGVLGPFQMLEEKYGHYSETGDNHRSITNWPTGIAHADINHLDLSEFLTFLAGLPWMSPHTLQVLVKEECDVSYSLYVLKDSEYYDPKHQIFVKVFKGESF